MIKQIGVVWLATVLSMPAVIKAEELDSGAVEEIHVWGETRSSDQAGYTTPTSVLLPKDMISINSVTTEDLVKFEPSLVIRRRFIGDSNGTLGMRGSNMFQTSRSMVFADGVPLHYFLQSRWNGAPRWSMVSASEIKTVEVIYGPFSAEYSGNAMGGVVLIETAIPQEREFHIDGSFFSQEFDDYGFDDQVQGYKGFMSYGDKIGDWSYYLSFNHLDNDSQPQTFRGASPSETVAEDTVSGGIVGVDARDRDQVWYGDTGIVDTVTDNFKFKLGYELDNWQALLNIGLEDRTSETISANSYIRDENGQTLWSGTDLVQDGNQFSFSSGRLNERELERKSLSMGLRIKGQLNTQTQLEANINQFELLKDENRSSALNANDPDFSTEGEIADIDDSGWQTAEVKLTVEDILLDGLELIAGARHENYELNLDVFESPNYLAGVKGDFSSRFGGITSTDALFVQANWDISESFDLSFGLRHERFESRNGYFSDDDELTPELDLTRVPSVDESKTSPKFSIGYQPDPDWLIRYSVAKAYRFPIVEELFRQYQAFNSINEANPELAPEDGLHHNLMFDRYIDGGYLRVNIFQDTVNDAIESQSTTIVGGVNDGVSLSTFVPLDETQARGIEFIANQAGMFLENLDIRFNLTFTRATVEENQSNPEWEGNTYPRMPKWRSNLLATYHITPDWGLGGNLQYASDSFGRIQNDDIINNVYGAQDAYTRVGVKTNYRLSSGLILSFGIDNLTNEIAYVAHPWPGRTLYFSFAYKL